jgi:hypothetical protein
MEPHRPGDSLARQSDVSLPRRLSGEYAGAARGLDIEALRIERGSDRDHVLTDGKASRMDISERRQSGV